MTLLELIKQQFPTSGNDYQAIADKLNAPTLVANPNQQPELVPVPITLKTLLALVPPAEAAAIYGLGNFVDDLKNAIDIGDREYMAYLLSVAVAAQAISASTVEKLEPLLIATEAVAPPDKIAGPSLASAAGLGVVTPAMVQAALNGGA